ncbi:MAG: helix-turn-helix transcriptional regulator [Oscillospiraceae bacterium]|nr:helix-turn-helix transcriptional regulator [Oscillospiraceae bacterium]
MHEEILSRLRPITAEENAILSGEGDIDRALYSEKDSNVINAHKLLDSGKLITIRPHTRFVHFPEHRHDYVEVVYMAQGSTTHIANGTRIELHEGELLFFGQGARQEILPAGENDLAVNFIILPPFFDKALEMLGVDETPLRRFILDSLREEASGFLYFKVADVLPVRNLVENLLWTLIHDVPNRRSINQTTMGLLFLQLVNHTEHLVTDRDEDSAMLKVFRYIEENYRDGSLTDLSALMHYDLYWLSRNIRTRTGKTYTELVQDKRLSQAAFLLRSTALRVDDVAAAVGYSNMSYFHRLFQTQYGMSPKKYRDKSGKPA